MGQVRWNRRYTGDKGLHAGFRRMFVDFYEEDREMGMSGYSDAVIFNGGAFVVESMPDSEEMGSFESVNDFMNAFPNAEIYFVDY